MEHLTQTSATLSIILRDARRKQRLTQGELADRSGVTQPTVSNAERGKAMQLDTLFSLLAVLGLELVVRSRDTDRLGSPWET